MKGFILDTSVLSALLDTDHPQHHAATSAAGDLCRQSAKYVSAVSLGEIRFGVRLAESIRPCRATEARCVLAKAEKYGVLGITEHTATAYGELKSCMALKYLKKAVRQSRPRWIEDWKDKATGKTLQVDENDLWQCAQARERDCVLVTADKGIQRIADADPELRLFIV